MKADARVALATKEAKTAQTELEDSANFDWLVHTHPNTLMMVPEMLR